MVTKVVEAHVIGGRLILVVRRQGLMRGHLYAIEKAVSDALGGTRVSVLSEAEWEVKKA
jgi:hypothetical protein